MTAFYVVIIGGGLSGTLLANGLLKNNVAFSLYERDEANSKREGYQIRLGEGSQAGFQSCLTQSQIDTIRSKLGRSTASDATAPALYTSQFKELADMSAIPSYTKSAAMNRVVLRDLLMEQIKINKRVHYRKAFLNYELLTQDDGTEKVKVYFHDGSSDICDVLVGADGSNSKINEQVGLNNIVKISTHWSFLSKGRLPYDRMMQLPAKLRESPIIVSSKGTILYYALYLPNNYNKSLDSKAFDYDEEEASFYWGLNIPIESLPQKGASEITDARTTCLDHIKDWAPEFHTMLTIGQDDPDASDLLITQFRASTRPKADWRESHQKAEGARKGHSRIWVIGDAVHPMQPNRGQGGNQAMADCADILPRLLHLNALAESGLNHPTKSDIDAACRSYEDAMMPRAFQWVSKSGGTSFPNINFDGWVGTLITVVVKIVLPFIKWYYSFTLRAKSKSS